MLALMDLFNLVKELRIVDRLVRQDDPAAAKLAEVLDELYKMVCALDEEIVRYLSLYFATEESIIRGRAVLLGMEVGQSRIRINEARGHCHKIANIYEKYIRRWFQDVLQKEEANKLKDVFENLSSADSLMIRAMESVTDWLVQEAEQTLNQVDNDDLTAANKRIRNARCNVKHTRVDLTEAMSILRGLQADLIVQSGTV
jgi:hypothetical protein